MLNTWKLVLEMLSIHTPSVETRMCKYLVVLSELIKGVRKKVDQSKNKELNESEERTERWVKEIQQQRHLLDARSTAPLPAHTHTASELQG